jgi:TonB family protein
MKNYEMKNCIFTLVLLQLFSSVFSQKLRYNVHGTYAHPITREKLHDARSMGDIIPYYPVLWILSYVSVEIVATCDGKAMIATSPNDILSTDQKNILNTVDLGANIIVNIDYKYKNPATDIIEINRMHYSTSVIPELEAEFPGGEQQMNKYLKEKAIDKISEGASKIFKFAIIKFTVDEEGKITNAQIATASGDPKIDKLLLKAINKMPKWKPAENPMGIKAKQSFEFSVGNNNEGC